MSESILEELCRKCDYLAEAPHWLRNICPDQGALNWFVKDNVGELSACGAIARIGRDYFIVKSRFPEAVKRLKGLDQFLLRVAQSDNGSIATLDDGARR
jgi:hypothetical protein